MKVVEVKVAQEEVDGGRRISGEVDAQRPHSRSCIQDEERAVLQPDFYAGGIPAVTERFDSWCSNRSTAAQTVTRMPLPVIPRLLQPLHDLEKRISEKATGSVRSPTG
ncbi:MAG: hypothetical protein M3252_04155 [Actinomycetota bacterium]|nr:hypothetical protein [Actinomycetota bacterium]